MRTITLATPVMGPMDPRTVASFMLTAQAFAQRGTSWTWDTVMQDPHLARARNVLVHRFLCRSRDPHDVLMFVDADMTWTPADLSDVVYSPEVLDGDIVAATYPKKTLSGEQNGVPLKGGATRGPLVEAFRAGTGFMAVPRLALERMVDAYPERVYTAGEETTERGQRVAALFSTEIDGFGRWVGDDWSFCDRFRSIGGRVWLRTGLRLGHVGAHVYGGAS